MDSRYQPEEIESLWHKTWKENKSFSPSGEGEAYSIVIPPPNVTGALHLGHALNNTVQDILVRWQRKLGKNTLWVPGTDHAGIATQAVVEKRLKENENKTRHDIGREALVQKIWDWKDEYEERISNQLKMMGSSCDWDKQRFTLDPICARAVRHTFFNLFKKQYIYRGKRLVNWDTHLQTAVADDEIYHETVQGKMYYFKYPLADNSGYLPVATTRPETILGDTAVAVHPEDERYKHLIGKTLRVPFVNREIPIIADGLLVDPEFGTGCVKVTPAHDPNDYQTGLRHNLPMINILTETGYLNENAGPFEGLLRAKGREAVVEAMIKEELLEKADDHEMQVGHSDRSKTPIEPFLSDQWFVAMSDLAERAIKVVEEGQIKFHPERYTRSYLDWLGEKRDWCISRQLWWGHRIPIWHCETCTAEELEATFGGRADIYWYKAENGSWLICAQEEDLADDALPGHKLTQDEDVLDTWFSSALWPHSTLGWPENTQDLKTFYPTSVLVTSRDIISLWVARMVITGLENIGEIPFTDVYIHPKILDGQGQTMSKSKGNGVDPLDIIAKYGTDALRYTMASLCTDNQDARLPVKPEKQEDGRTINTSEKFELGRNFANKLWNACRFIEPHLNQRAAQIDESLLALEDRWILSRAHSTLKKVNESLESYKFNDIVNTLYHFTWNDLCSNYLEIKKKVLTSEEATPAKANGLAVFAEVLELLLGALHPVMPFITEELNQLLFKKESLISSPWPKLEEGFINSMIEEDFERIFSIVEAARSIRGQYGISPSMGLKCEVHLDDAKDLDRAKANEDLIVTLAKLDSILFASAAKAPGFAAQKIIAGATVFVLLEGILDKDKEIAKLEKEIQKTEGFIISLKKKLSNEKFVSGAPAQVVAFEKEKLANQEDMLQKAQDALANLKA